MPNISFVSTAILESKDGIEFKEEVRKESEEVKEAERIAKEAENKPLWQQLAAKREEQEAKFNAVRSALFAPPRPLDEEESNFLQGVETQRLEAKQRKENWEAEELRGFAIARANQTVVVAEPKKVKPNPRSADAAGGKGSLNQGATSSAPPPPVVAVKIKSKRKQKDKGQRTAKKKPCATEASQGGEGGGTGNDEEPVPRIRMPGVVASPGSTVTKQAKAPSSRNGEAAGGEAGDTEKNGQGLSSLLGGYGSGSDSDSDDEDDTHGPNDA